MLGQRVLGVACAAVAALWVAALPPAKAGLSPDTCVAGPDAASAKGATTGYVSTSWTGGQPHLITLTAARDIWGWQEGGKLVSGVDTLERALDATAGVDVPSVNGVREGVPIVFANVPAYTPDTGTRFAGSNVYPSLALLACLRASYGAEIGMAYGANYNHSLSGLTADQVRADTCGVQQRYVDHGFMRTWGAYAYADGKLTSSATPVVSSCFAFSRVYGAGVNRYASVTTSPYKLVTLSLAGGSCNQTGVACSTVFTRKYMLPGAITSALMRGSGVWTSIQFYHLVTGARNSGYVRWDCTSPNPASHWTSRGEFYCQQDLTAALTNAMSNLALGSYRFVDPVSAAYITGRGRAPGAS